MIVATTSGSMYKKSVSGANSGEAAKEFTRNWISGVKPSGMPLGCFSTLRGWSAEELNSALILKGFRGGEGLNPALSDFEVARSSTPR